MISYFNQIEFDGKVISCDNLRIEFVLNSRKDCISDVVNYFSNSFRVDIKGFPQDTRDFHYKYFFNISYTCACGIVVLTVAFVFNGTDFNNDQLKGYIDFNPNKIGDNLQFWQDYRFLKSNCEEFKIKRLDIALDIPTSRQNVVLMKDNRLYGIKAYSLDNRTEYLGLRSNIGFVKVYNKTLESKLNYALTRIETTCECSVDSFYKHFPKVFDLESNIQLSSEMLSLSDTDLAIVRLWIQAFSLGIDNGAMFFNSLGRNKKQKLKDFIVPESCLVIVPKTIVFELTNKVCALYL